MSQQITVDRGASTPQWLHTRTDAWKVIQEQEAEARLEVVSKIQQANTRQAVRTLVLFVAFVTLLGAGVLWSSLAAKNTSTAGESLAPTPNLAVAAPSAT